MILIIFNLTITAYLCASNIFFVLKIGSFILAILMLYSSLHQAYITIYYFAYQDYIIKELCEQKDNQQGCNGKCFLMKNQSTEVSSNGKSTLPNQNEKQFRGDFIVYYKKNAAFVFADILKYKKNQQRYYLQKTPVIYLKKETPPPKNFI